jgi:hypothetical protein
VLLGKIRNALTSNTHTIFIAPPISRPSASRYINVENVGEMFLLLARLRSSDSANQVLQNSAYSERHSTTIQSIIYTSCEPSKRISPNKYEVISALYPLMRLTNSIAPTKPN